MVNDIVPGATIKSTLTSIQRAREDVDRTSLRLATGKRVNSVLDQPSNFFKSANLNSTAKNYDRSCNGTAPMDKSTGSAASKRASAT